MTRPLSDREFLSLWERCSEHHAIDRALLILHAADPECGPESLARLAVGERNLRLLRAHHAMFGHPLAAVSVCSDCDAALEFEVPIDALANVESEAVENETSEQEIGGFRLALRALDSHDLAAAARCADAGEAESLLLSRSVVRLQGSEAPVAPESLPDDVKHAISEWLSRRDPLADLTFALTCPECGSPNEAATEIVDLVWSDIARAASRIFTEVALLARTYGWQEEQILTMRPARRRVYLHLGGVG